MHKLFWIVSLILSGMAILVACKHEIPQQNIPDPPPGSNLVCFESEILPIFQTNCAKSGCHDAATANEGYVFDTYANIIRRGIDPGDANRSEVYEVLFERGDDRMPQPPNPPLTDEQKALIGRWINEGAQNTTNCGTNCDSTQFLYSANVRSILNSYCVGCHGNVNPEAGIDLTAYNSVRNVALNGRLMGAITHAPGYQPMPRNANKLSDCQITQIRKWIESGAPNN